MAVKIRLQQVGARKQPRYRIVVINQESGSSAGYIEKIGNYFPETSDEENELDLDSERAMKWLKDGAKPSPTVKDLLSEEGVLEKLEEEQSATVS